MAGRISIMSVFNLVVILAIQGASVGAGTITVSGTGTVITKPNLAEIELTVQGQDEVAGDAIKKYDQAIKQITTAVEKLKLENLKTEMLGLGISQAGATNQQVFNGQAQTDVKLPISFAKGVKLSLEKIEDVDEAELNNTLAKVLDAAKDAGASIKNQNPMAQYWGQQMNNTMVHFVVEEIDAAREKAYSQAIQKARTRAERLADLAGLKISGVESINESFSLPVDDANQQTRIIYAMYGMQQNEKKETRVVSSEFKPIAVEVTLTIEFAMESK